MYSMWPKVLTHVKKKKNPYECGVIFAVPQICAYFVDNPYNLEIDSFEIADSKHILLYSSPFVSSMHLELL